MNDLCLRFAEVGKRFRRAHLDAMLLRELLPKRRRPETEDEFWALSQVSFEVGAGQSVAVLGRNGSGKSTLLGLCAGTILPTSGRVSVRGRVAPILGLGIGFEPDMTAAENAYLSASLLGAGPEEIAEALPRMIAFADLGDFVDTPVRHYSSGMLARLGFAVAMHVEREILLIDEVLAVGDHAFQARCLERIGELRRRGLTLLVATHDLELATRLCDRGLWLKEGQLELDAEIGPCVEAYRA